MPLLDHFRPPLTEEFYWQSFHSAWAVAIMQRLNLEWLPRDRYRAQTQVRIGSHIEIDVATLERGGAPPAAGEGAVAVATWSPPAAPWRMPAEYPDDIEVYVSEAGERWPVAAIELVSPRNKDRPESRRAFAAKCLAYLQRGIGLVVVDIVTTRQANMHHELLELLRTGQPRFAGDPELYVVAYHPVRRDGTEEVEMWPATMAVGQPLPTVPLTLQNGPVIPLDLELTYTDARLSNGLD
jgi:hypothetical protein